MSEHFWALVVRVLGSVLAKELELWAPALAKRLLRFHSARIPEPLAQRLREEWDATADSIPGPFAKLIFALDLFRAVPGLQHEFRYPGLLRQPLHYRATTRLLDHFICLSALLLLGPVFLVLALLVRLTMGPGPVFSIDSRRGLHGSVYRQLRFRVHRSGSGILEPTRFGALLRKLDLDALPVLWNVVRGDMALVGPRPQRPDLDGTVDDRAKSLLSVRPGITGPHALLRRTTRDVSRFERLQREIEFIEGASLADWLRIIVATIRVALVGGPPRSNRTPPL